LRYGDTFRKHQVEPIYLTLNRSGETYSQYRSFTVKYIGDEDDSIRCFFRKVTKLALKMRPRTTIVLLADWANYKEIKLLNKQGINTIYVNTMVQSKSNSFNPIKRALSNYLNRKYLNAFKNVVCSTETLKMVMIDFGVRENKLKVISNGVDLKRFHKVSPLEKQKLRRKLGLPDGFLVLFIGLKVERKGVLELVKAWLKYKEEDGEGYLVLVGDEQRSNPAFQDFYRDWDILLGEIRTKHKIVLQGPTNDVEIYFQACDIFTFLSKKEGMPNVLTEAMASGLPIIMTPFEGYSFGAWGEPGRQYWLLDNWEVNEIKEAILKLSKDALIREKFSQSASTFVIENHDLHNSVKQYVSLICAE